MPERPERTQLHDGLTISRLVCGLWQVADMEKAGADAGSRARRRCARRLCQGRLRHLRHGRPLRQRGADHRPAARSATPRRRPVAFTKWCPEPGPMTPDVVRKGVAERLERLGVAKVDLLQFHWWTFEHPAWLDALHEMAKLREEGLIGAIGVTNFDAAHLAAGAGRRHPDRQQPGQLLAGRSPRRRRAVRALQDHGREAAGLWHLVRRLPVGELAGQAGADHHPRLEPVEIQALHRRRRRVECLSRRARGRRAKWRRSTRSRSPTSRPAGCSITRPSPAASSARASARASTATTISSSSASRWMTDDQALLERSFAGTKPIPGDCGDEYRKPPFLTASGDLSHHLSTVPNIFSATPMQDRPGRQRVSSGSVWEPIAGYSRAVRIKDRILVSGTTATHGANRCVAPGDAGAQTTYILDKIAAAIAALGGSMEDVVRTRIYLRDAAKWEPVARAHGRVFGEIMPGQHADRGRQPDRRLRGRDRGRGDRRRLGAAALTSHRHGRAAAHRRVPVIEIEASRGQTCGSSCRP